MTGPRCVQCAARAGELHHAVGRSLDMAFTVPVCHDHHELYNADDWNIAGHPDTWEPPTRLHALAVGLERAAMLVGRAAEAPLLAGAEPLLRPLAAWLAACALELFRILEMFDAQLPAYRHVLANGR